MGIQKNSQNAQRHFINKNAKQSDECVSLWHKYNTEKPVGYINGS